MTDPEPFRGMALLRLLADEGKRVFTIADARKAAPQAGIAPSYLKTLLRRLAEGEWIRRIKRGTYAMGAGLPAFPLDLHPFAIGMALVQPAAVSGWAALNHYGLTDQIPRITTLTTTKHIATPAMRGAVQSSPSSWQVGEYHFEIVTVVPAHFFGIDEIWVGEDRVQIFDPERTALDCFALPRKFGGISEGLGILEQHLHEFDVERLVAHAQQYGSDAVAKRVGYALELFGADENTLAPLREIPIKGYRLLDPTKPARGRRSNRWGLRDNLVTERAA